jgi:hypothetical protein
MIETTGAGVLCEPMNPQALADAIARLAIDRQLAAEYGRRGFEAIRRLHSAERMAEQHLELYRRVLGSQRIGTITPGSTNSSRAEMSSSASDVSDDIALR